VEVEAFVSNEAFPDSMTYDLVGAASEVLGASASAILISFGEHWVLKTAATSYGAMMRAVGASVAWLGLRGTLTAWLRTLLRKESSRSLHYARLLAYFRAQLTLAT
jgi:hypothetical protein